MSHRSRQIKVISYEGSSYKTDFWEGQGREYEDLTERQAIRRLLPTTGKMIVEIGAGFGRLADLYKNYEQVILLDYSLSLLQEAKQTFGNNSNYRFIAANVYNLPLADNVADAIVMIRVAHHLASIETALNEIQRVIQGERTFIMEFANKRNAKAILRYALKKQSWSPFAKEPYEFVPLNFDFHPRWMKQALRNAGFQTEETLALSSFRLKAIKNRISPQTLARIDNIIAKPGAPLALSPSILTKNRSVKQSVPANGLFICPQCKSPELHHGATHVVCTTCGSQWPIIEGVIDFRHPRPQDA